VPKPQHVNWEKRQLPKRISISSGKDLRVKLLEGISSLEKGHGLEGEEAFRVLRERVNQRKSHA
jgi:hypothetical protein